MGSFREGDGPPSDNGGLPDLPPEWGVVLIPDDLSELDRETSALRREQRRSVRRAKWRRRFGLPAKSGTDDDNPPVGTPLLIMAIAIVAALTSLFAITLSTRTNSVTTPPPRPATPAVTPHMISLSLPNAATNKAINLQSETPAVILILDGCACDALISQTAAEAPQDVHVVIVDKIAPVVPAGDQSKVIALVDSQQALRATYGPGVDRNATPGNQVTALLVDSAGNITQTVNRVDGLSAFKDALTNLK
jgi:hypothetical protein